MTAVAGDELALGLLLVHAVGRVVCIDGQRRPVAAARSNVRAMSGA